MLTEGTMPGTFISAGRFSDSGPVTDMALMPGAQERLEASGISVTKNIGPTIKFMDRGCGGAVHAL